MGDVQFKRHYSENNNNLIYWKTTKDFADGCAAHLTRGHYAIGAVLLPDQGGFVMEEMDFGTGVGFEANHHCNIGVTGMLCAPTYIFENCSFASRPSFWWSGDDDDMSYGAIFVLAPNATIVADSSPFPSNFTSLANGIFAPFLLPHPDGACVRSESLGLGSTYSYGILCATDVRLVKVWTFDMNKETAPPLRVELWNNATLVLEANTPLYVIGDEQRKQGYRFPVFPRSGFQYRVSLNGSAVPADWVVEFSDPTYGHRYPEEFLDLRIASRSCPSAPGVSSLHDRAYVFSSSSEYLGTNARGRGACTKHEDSPPLDCGTVPPLELLTCDSDVCGVDCGGNAYCRSSRRLLAIEFRATFV